MNLGSSRFCIAKYFDIIDDQDDYESRVSSLAWMWRPHIKRKGCLAWSINGLSVSSQMKSSGCSEMKRCDVADPI